MKSARNIVIATLVLLALDAILVRLLAHGHVAHALLAGGPSLGAAALAAALVVVRFVAVVIVPGMLATAGVLATADYFVGSYSTGTSPGGGALAEAEGTGTSIDGRGTE